MTLSVLAYSLFTSLNYFAQPPWHLAVFRFIAAHVAGVAARLDAKRTIFSGKWYYSRPPATGDNS